MDEHCRPISGKYDVRPTREARASQPISETSGMERMTHKPLQLGIGAADAGHHPAAGRMIDDIGHAADDRRRLL
ncbi:MAG TPA: hypothetical protein VFL96_01775 [Acidobacteriaceae bacterium]|nr:hypothetical protein [Acidobacteriaceae bacterium]